MFVTGQPIINAIRHTTLVTRSECATRPIFKTHTRVSVSGDLHDTGASTDSVRRFKDELRHLSIERYSTVLKWRPPLITMFQATVLFHYLTCGFPRFFGYYLNLRFAPKKLCCFWELWMKITRRKMEDTLQDAIIASVNIFSECLSTYYTVCLLFVCGFRNEQTRMNKRCCCCYLTFSRASESVNS